MLQYPSINGWKRTPQGHNEHCIAFEKYDGSNLRWEWNPKGGWAKYGTRRQLFDKETPIYGEAVELFKDNMADVIVDTVLHHYGKKTERITAFTEFLGDSSFAGSHVDEEPKRLMLFDVFLYKKGFIEPTRFVKLFDRHDWAAEVIYEGPMSKQFVEDVRHGAYPVFEGVICKGKDWMSKIKTFAYINQLKAKYGERWTEFGE